MTKPSLGNLPNKNPSTLKRLIADISPHYIKLRQHLHAHPELGFEEQATATLIVNELKRLGIQSIDFLAETGICAIIDSGKPGKTIALRAEMDALPIQEVSDLPYRSKYANKMHACGHDGHTATLLAVAGILQRLKFKFCGKVKLIFQPAEEQSLGGAAAMIQAGILENPSVDAIFAFHNYPGEELGVMMTKPGCALAGNINFTIIVYGKSGHVANPEQCIDPIYAASRIVQAIPTIGQELSITNQPLIIKVTKFNSGTSKNIVPDTASLAGTIRAFEIAQLDLARQKLTEIVHNIAMECHVKTEIQTSSPHIPTINTPKEVEFVFAVAKTILRKNKIKIKPMPARASEDFGLYLAQVPGCYFFMGNGNAGSFCHNSSYNFNDDLIAIATELLCQLIFDSHKI